MSWVRPKGSTQGAEPRVGLSVAARIPNPKRERGRWITSSLDALAPFGLLEPGRNQAFWPPNHVRSSVATGSVGPIPYRLRRSSSATSK